jgi:hypothetical protein
MNLSTISLPLVGQQSGVLAPIARAPLHNTHGAFSLGALAIGGGKAAVMAIVTNTFNSDPPNYGCPWIVPRPPSPHLSILKWSQLPYPKVNFIIK